MRNRVLVGAMLLIGILAVGTLAASDVGATPSRQWAIATFQQPTLIAGHAVLGTVMIAHDDELMAKGESCTTVYRFDSSKGPQEKIVSFMCKPVQREVVEKTTFTCNKISLIGTDRLTEYQFAGDKEAHEVPIY